MSGYMNFGVPSPWSYVLLADWLGKMTIRGHRGRIEAKMTVLRTPLSPASSACSLPQSFLRPLNLLLHLLSELKRMSYFVERLGCTTRSPDDNSSIAHHSAPQAFSHSDALDFR